MNATTDELDDLGTIPSPNEGNGEEWELLSPGAYKAVLKDIQTVDKPEWKIKEGEDTKQYEWTFEFTEEGYEERTIKAWSNRTWTPPKATSWKYACALYGREVEPGETVKASLLRGQTCQLVIKVYKKQDGEERNAVESVLPPRAPRKVQGSRAESSGAEDTLGLRKRLTEAYKSKQSDGWSPAELQAELAKFIPAGSKLEDLKLPEQLKAIEHIEALGNPEDLEF